MRLILWFNYEVYGWRFRLYQDFGKLAELSSEAIVAWRCASGRSIYSVSLVAWKLL